MQVKGVQWEAEKQELDLQVLNRMKSLQLSFQGYRKNKDNTALTVFVLWDSTDGRLRLAETSSLCCLDLKPPKHTHTVCGAPSPKLVL